MLVVEAPSVKALFPLSPFDFQDLPFWLMIFQHFSFCTPHYVTLNFKTELANIHLTYSCLKALQRRVLWKILVSGFATLDFLILNTYKDENTNIEKQVKGILTWAFFSFAIKRRILRAAQDDTIFSLLSVLPGSWYPSYQCGWFLLRAYVHVRYTEKYQVRLCNLKGEKCCLASALAFELASSCHFQASTEVG